MTENQKKDTPTEDVSEEQLADIVKSLAKWKNKRGALIMALHEVQGMLGFVPWNAAKVVSEQLNVPVARIYEVLTFYNYFKLESPGKFVVSICDGTACHIKGSEKIITEFSNQLQISPGQSTDDKLFHLQSVRCLGCCGLAPVVVINGKTYGKVTADGVGAILDEWRKQV